jgi:hypothetical protein
MKCKVINSYKSNLEVEVNKWLESGKYEIIKTEQTQGDGYITLTIFYLDIKEARVKKIEKIEKLK